MHFFKTILDMPLPTELDSFTEDMDDIADRDSNVCWKLKAITAKVTYRLFAKYASLKYCSEKGEEFNKKF